VLVSLGQSRLRDAPDRANAAESGPFARSARRASVKRERALVHARVNNCKLACHARVLDVIRVRSPCSSAIAR
jgi:hypothetical protein